MEGGPEDLEVGDGAGDEAGVVEGGREGDDASGGEAAIGWLQAADAAVGGGASDRAAGLGAERGRHHAGGDGCG